jgi:hypothetical protein
MILFEAHCSISEMFHVEHFCIRRYLNTYYVILILKITESCTDTYCSPDHLDALASEIAEEALSSRTV